MQDPEAEEGPNPLRQFRIEVAADSMVHLDEEAEKESRVEFLTATSGFIQGVAKALQGVPAQMGAVLIPLFMEMLKFGVTGYRVGKTIEGAFDEAAEQLKKLAQQPPPQPAPDPAMQTAQVKAQAEERKAQLGVQTAERKAAMDERGMMREEQHDVQQLGIDAERMRMEEEHARMMPPRGRPQ